MMSVAPDALTHLSVIADVISHALLSKQQPTLTKLLCDGNPQLTSAPENMRANSALLLFCLEMQQKFKDVLDPKEAQHRELKTHNENLHHQLSQARREVQRLEKEVSHLEWERPDWYIKWKGKFVGFICYVLGKLGGLFGRVKEAFWNWRERKKTHPLY